MTTTATALAEACRSLLHRKIVGILPEERALLSALSRGEVYLESLPELGRYFEVHPSAFSRWWKWDPDGALRCAPYNVRRVELVRAKMIREGQRHRLRQSDLWPAMRREAGL